MRIGASARPREKIEPEKWDRLKLILHEGLEQRSAAARVAVIKRHCGQDADLLREAQSLLAAAELLRDEPTDWLEDGAEKATATFWKDELSREGERLGAYAVVRQLGRGGMGAVYLAARADGQFEKQVAIKILHRGTNTDEILARFKTERQIVASLDHPNIARLLDAGMTADGLPYFVMEFVAGMPVTRFLARQNLPIKARLGVFLKICAAVEVAHRAGVVHRDLKPGNILVTADGEPKLLDFGIAKVLAPAESAEIYTAAGREHLTPHSASPEQVRGELVTPASDVYALGALLYEMLTGRSPHQFSVAQPSREEVIRVICEGEISVPSRVVPDQQLCRDLRGDLDNILLHAMRKEPSRRYPSVAEFAEDIRSHLEAGVVKARPAGLGYRFERFVARNDLRSVRSIATGVILLAIGGGLGTLFFNRPKLSRFTAARVEAQSPSNLPEKSIAVLPFENLSAEPENAFFAGGVQDAILTDLSKIAELKVINRTSVRQYASNEPRDLREISKELNVAYVLEGSVQRAGNRIRVTAKLTDTRTNAQTWAERYEHDLADVFALQDEIARQVAGRLRVAISPQERSAVQAKVTDDLIAYDFYLRAKEAEQNARRTEDNLQEQVSLLEQAVARDPNFVSALCSLARVHLLAYFFFDPSQARLDLAKQALEAAARVSPEAGEVHLTRGVFFYWGKRDYPAALSELGEAQRSLPNDSDVPFFTGLIERRQGRWEESIRRLETAAALDPRSANIVYELANSYNGLKRYPEAARMLDNILAWKGGDFVFAHARAMIDVASRADLRKLRDLATVSVGNKATSEELEFTRLELALWEQGYGAAEEALARLPGSRIGPLAMPREWYEGVIAQGLGENEKAQAAFEKTGEAAARTAGGRPENGMDLMFLAEVDARLGRAGSARRRAERATQLVSVTGDATGGPEMLVRLAAIYGRLGETARALDILEKTAQVPFGPPYGFLQLNEMWDPLRQEPRFRELLDALAPKESTR